MQVRVLRLDDTDLMSSMVLDVTKLASASASLQCTISYTFKDNHFMKEDIRR